MKIFLPFAGAFVALFMQFAILNRRADRAEGRAKEWQAIAEKWEATAHRAQENSDSFELTAKRNEDGWNDTLKDLKSALALLKEGKR